MPELGVYSTVERDRLREALTQFKRQRGNIGDSKLHALMSEVLDPQHLVYLSQSTMQRFLRGQGRTTDEAVWAIATFIDRAIPSAGATKFAEALCDQFVVPAATYPPVFLPMEKYQGRYEAYIEPSSGAHYDTEFRAPISSQYLFFPTPDPRLLHVWTYDPTGTIPRAFSSFFMRCGAYQFLLIHAGLTGSFTLLLHVDDDPVTLQGKMISTGTDWPPHSAPFEFRLVQVAAPKIDYKPRPGQYGSQAAGPSSKQNEPREN